MKIEKAPLDAIKCTFNSDNLDRTIHFETEAQRDVIFKHWKKALEELEASKAIYRPVYESKEGNINILSLRYTTPDEILEVEKKRFEHFGDTMKLIGVYNELERTFEQVNF